MVDKETKIGYIVGLAIIIGATIGGGFWATPIVAGAITGPISIFITLLVGGLILLAVPSYVILSRAWPNSPGHYYFPTRMLIPENKMVSQLIGWVVNWAAIFIGGFTVTRYMTVSGASFLHNLFPSVSTGIFTLLLITISFVVVWFGIEIAGRAEVVLAAILLMSMSVVVLYGFTEINLDNLTPVAPYGLTGILSAFGLLVSLGAGPFLAVDIGGEIEDPNTSIQNVIFAGGAANVGFGILIGIVALSVIPHTQLGGVTLNNIAQQNFPNIITLISGIGSLLAGVTSNIGYVLIVDRYTMAAADDRILPTWVGKRNQYEEPLYLLIFMYLLSVVAIVLNLPLSAIASGFAFVLIMQITLILLVGIRIPSKYPHLFELENVKGSWYLRPKIVRWTASLGALVTISVFIFLGFSEPVTAMWYIGIALAGVLIYTIRIWQLGKDNIVFTTSQTDQIASDD